MKGASVGHVTCRYACIFFASRTSLNCIPAMNNGVIRWVPDYIYH